MFNLCLKSNGYRDINLEIYNTLNTFDLNLKENEKSYISVVYKNILIGIQLLVVNS